MLGKGKRWACFGDTVGKNTRKHSKYWCTCIRYWISSCRVHIICRRPKRLSYLGCFSGNTAFRSTSCSTDRARTLRFQCTYRETLKDCLYCLSALGRSCTIVQFLLEYRAAWWLKFDPSFQTTFCRRTSSVFFFGWDKISWSFRLSIILPQSWIKYENIS